MKSGTKTVLIVILALLLVLSIGACAFLFFGRKDETSAAIDPSMSDSEVVQYLKEQLSETQKQLTDANILLKDYLKQLDESNKNNTSLTEQNQALSSTIQSLQETVSSLNAEVQRLTALLEEYGKIADGTWEVHFYDGEEMIKLLLIRNNTKITETVTAEKEGYTFLGWATEQGGQVVDYKDIQITQATNFYAVFERISGLFNDQGVKIKTWDELVSQGDITLDGNTISKASTGINGYLILPDTITAIGKKAFENCDRLVGLDCYGVTKIYEYALENCLRLREINYGEKIGFGVFAFMRCESLRSIVLPKETWFLTYPNLSSTLYLAEIVNNSSYSNEEVKGWFNINTYSVDNVDIDDWEGIHSGESRIKTIEGVNYYIYNEYYIAVGVADGRENIKISNDCNRIIAYAFEYQDQLKNVALRDMAEDADFVLDHLCFSRCTGLETIWVPTWLVYGSARKAEYGEDSLMHCSSATVYIESKNNPYGRDMTNDINNFMKESNKNSDNPGPKGFVTDISKQEYLQRFGF